MDPDNHLAIGKIVKAWGIKGKVKILSYAESPATFRQQTELVIHNQRDSQRLSLESVDEHKKGILLKFKGRDRIEDVEDLIGLTLYVDKKNLPPPEEGEHYWHELIGMTVETDSGQRLGKLTNIIPTGSNDVYVVRQGEREWLIPAIQDVIREIKVEEQLMIISPMEGILKENDL